ncbi:hypothetical protein [Mucilaginibacter gotjawali]|uniref:Uncharacterized protein n=2 Tax=Mucilaginibacter gotjawali TaxID=1550579 RepID=A0A0X8X9M5_9SPHI|nr:hypothetical protein [Mucilaginibacter gotjawali]MBB3056834.1 hypothetical protein [Mucilaginibacter gotjawali]BAU55914.1 hypothetical protein MgSA37_04106 [Mucilaginibacter gotjawali]
MKRLIYSLLALLIVVAMGCQKGPYPYITKTQAKQIDSLVHPGITGAAFIYKSNIYYVADFTKPVVQVTTDGSAARFVKISHDHTKFAYLDANNAILIVDHKGTLITKLTQYTSAKSFDWSADDKTLYILNSSTMAYYGPALKLPAFAYPGIVGGSNTDILSASVSINGDFVYVVHSFNFNNGDTYELVMVPAATGKAVAYSNPDMYGYKMNYVGFAGTSADLVVGYTDPNGYTDALVTTELFSNMNTYPDASYPVTNSASPVYNSSLDYLVATYVDPDTNNAIEPAAIYLGTPPVFIDANTPHTIVLNKYSIGSGILYSDWK